MFKKLHVLGFFFSTWEIKVLSVSLIITFMKRSCCASEIVKDILSYDIEFVFFSFLMYAITVDIDLRTAIIQMYKIMCVINRQ